MRPFCFGANHPWPAPNFASGKIVFDPSLDLTLVIKRLGPAFGGPNGFLGSAVGTSLYRSSLPANLCRVHPLSSWI